MEQWIEELKEKAKTVANNANALPGDYSWPEGEQLVISPYYSVRRFVASASPSRILELIAKVEELTEQVEKQGDEWIAAARKRVAEHADGMWKTIIPSPPAEGDQG